MKIKLINRRRNLTCEEESFIQHFQVINELDLINSTYLIKASKCAYILLLMATFWVTQCIPIGLTGMMPALLFPFFGIMKSTDVSAYYMKVSSLLSSLHLYFALPINSHTSFVAIVSKSFWTPPINDYALPRILKQRNGLHGCDGLHSGGRLRIPSFLTS